MGIIREMLRLLGTPSLVLLALLLVIMAPLRALSPEHTALPVGIGKRTVSRPYLNMPHLGSGTLPALLSQTGVFSDTARLEANAAFVPYDLIVAFWSDGARKSRMVAVPQGHVTFAPDVEWKFPEGTVFVKTFFLATDALNDKSGAYGNATGASSLFPSLPK